MKKVAITQLSSAPFDTECDNLETNVNWFVHYGCCDYSQRWEANSLGVFILDLLSGGKTDSSEYMRYV